MCIYYIIWLVIVVFYITSYANKDINNLDSCSLLGVAVVLVLLAGFRAVDVSMDGYNYVRMFDSVSYYSDWFWTRNEPMATIIPVTLKYLGIYSHLSVFFLFATLGVGLQAYAIYKYSKNVYLSVLYYYSYFFLLHEMTQIRAGVAIGILMLSISDIYEKRFIGFCFKILLATTFHVSALVFFIAYFINTRKMYPKTYLIILIAAIIVGVSGGVNIFNLVPGLTSMSKKLAAYQILMSNMQDVNLWNVISIFYLILLIALLVFGDTVLKTSKYAIINFKIFYFGVIALFVFNSVPVIAWRISELFCSFVIFNVTYLHELMKPRFFATIMLVLSALMLLSVNLFKQNLVGPYHTIF